MNTSKEETKTFFEEVNTFLVKIASVINALVGMAIILFGALFAGMIIIAPYRSPFIFFGVKSVAAAIIVFCVSIALAALVCRLIAHLSEIERHLREIKQRQGSIGDSKS